MNRDVLARKCNNYFPKGLPKKTQKFAYGSKSWIQFCTDFQSFFELLFDKSEASKLCTDADCIHILFLANFFMQTHFLTLEDAENDKSPLYWCGFLLSVYVKRFKNESISRKEEILMVNKEKRLRSAMYKRCNRFAQNITIYKLHKIQVTISAFKKTVNYYVLKYVETKKDFLCRFPFLSDCYVQKVAITRMIFHLCTNITTPKLMSLLHVLIQNTKEITVLQRCHWNLYVINFLCSMLKSRLESKLWEVNEPGCTCQTKCLGLVGSSPIQDIVYDLFKDVTEIITCGTCCLTFNTENSSNTKIKKNFVSNSTDKARRNLFVSLPGVQSCALDGNTSLKKTKLISMNVNRNNTYSFSHRMFVPNATTLLQEISGFAKKKSKTTLYGICYGGPRTCTNKFLKVWTPKKSDQSAFFENKQADWSRCFSCVENNRIFDISIEIMDCTQNDTCIGKYFRSSGTVPVERFCSGCLMAILCRHFQLFLYQIHVTRKVQKILLLTRAQILAKKVLEERQKKWTKKC